MISLFGNFFSRLWFENWFTRNSESKSSRQIELTKGYRVSPLKKKKKPFSSNNRLKIPQDSFLKKTTLHGTLSDFIFENSDKDLHDPKVMWHSSTLP